MKRSLWSVFAILLVVAAVSSSTLHSAPLSEDEDVALFQRMSRAVSKISEATLPAVVFITVEKVVEPSYGGAPGQPYNNPFGFFDDDMLRRFFGPQMQPDPRQYRQQGAGSGFLITKDGYILTNSHVVGDADKITVRLNDGREFEATRVGSDEKSEVALIKIEADDLPVLELGDSAALHIGEFVIAIGNPFGLSETVTFGSVSALKRNNIGIADYEDFIQTDAAINPGNSGGPLVNTRGEVVGINTAIYSRNGGHMGIGFAIPVNMAKAIKDQLMETGRVSRGYLGVIIQEVDEQLAESFGLESADGILVAEVQDDSAADEAGLKQGDVVLTMNGAPVGTSVPDFRNSVSANPPGTELELEIIRDGKHKTITVTTGALPGEAVAEAVSQIYEDLGVTVENITDEHMEQLGIRRAAGVIVTEADPRGLAAQAGIRPGTLITSVNLKPVENINEFMEALKISEETSRVVLRIRQGRYHRYVAFSLE